MNKIRAIDARILEQFQRFCDWLTKTFGMTEAPYKMANIVLVIIPVIIPIFVISDYLSGSHSVFIFAWCIFAIAAYIFLGFILKKQIEIEQKLERQNAAEERTLKPPEKFFFDRWLACLATCLNPPLFTIAVKAGEYLRDKDIVPTIKPDYLILSITLISFTELLIYFFLNCSSLPPTKSKVRVWWEKLVLKLKFKPAKQNT
jgi:hypothetical protein